MISKEIKNRLIIEIEKYGNVYAACLKIGVNRSTVYRWVNKNKRLKKEIEEAITIGRANICDMAENSVLQNIKNGNQKAAEYVLSHNSDRYRKKETSNVVIVHKKDFTPLVREPSLKEILDVHDRIFEENEKEIEAIEEKEEEEKIKKDREKNITEEVIIEEQVNSTPTPDSLEEVEIKPIGRRPRPRNKEDRHYF